MRSLLLLTFIVISTLSYAQEKTLSNAGEEAHRLTLATIKSYYTDLYQEEVMPVYKKAGTDAEKIYKLLVKKSEDEFNVSLARDGFEFALAAHRLGAAKNADSLKQMAINIATYIVDTYLRPEGYFLEYDRNTWLSGNEMWRTIPWGTAFRGNEMMDVYQELYNDFTSEQREEWRRDIKKIGAFIQGNPIAGGFVFNATIDLCRLLWRIGDQLEHQEWKDWSIEAAYTLIRRNVDEQGWILGENGGASGRYQLVGSKFLAEFAYESQDPLLIETIDEIFSMEISFATPTLMWIGNFGTRSDHLGTIDPEIILYEAAMGNFQAGWLLQQYGEPSWGSNIKVWKKALSVSLKEPEYEKVVTFPAIHGTVVREGPFQAWFFDYEKSIWARGFAGLWHADHNNVIFATMHSLPEEVEKDKLRLDETTDWAGFPHVRITGTDQTYDSQQDMQNLTVGREQGVHVNWQEELKSSQGSTGGIMESTYSFEDNVLTMDIRLKQLKGPAYLDFHVMKKADDLFSIWAGSEVDSIRAGILPASGGSFRDRAFDAAETRQFALQINQDVYGFTLGQAPERTKIILGILKYNGLHTRNHGGVRMRLELPQKSRKGRIRVKFEKIKR